MILIADARMEVIQVWQKPVKGNPAMKEVEGALWLWNKEHVSNVFENGRKLTTELEDLQRGYQVGACLGISREVQVRQSIYLLYYEMSRVVLEAKV